MEYVYRQPVSIVARLMLKALEKREENKAWGMWLALYPHMHIPQALSEKPPLKFIPFSEFHKQQVAPVAVKEELSAEEIVIKFEEVKRRHQQKTQFKRPK